MMGKNKKRKNSTNRGREQNVDGEDGKSSRAETAQSPPGKHVGVDANPLRTSQRRLLHSLPPSTIGRFFSPEVSPERRATLWETQAELGESLVDQYAWATPDDRCLGVFRHFGRIVEVGCGANAYWARWMNGEGGVDVVALDASLDAGGKISVEKGDEGVGSKKKSKKRKAAAKNGDTDGDGGGLSIRRGGPETLLEDAELRDSGRALFLCYPDEEEYRPPDDDDDEEEDEHHPTSMAASCLEHFTGSIVIHVGELFGDTLSLDQAPFGRSSSSEFQQRLFGEYHCLLKMRLENNWLHVRDTLSVWKRSETCCISFQTDEDVDDDGGDANGGGNDNDDADDDDDDAYYKYIPPDEVLPVDVAAPCVAHLLGKSENWGTVRQEHSNAGDTSLPTANGPVRKKKQKKKKKVDDVVAGNAW